MQVFLEDLTWVEVRGLVAAGRMRFAGTITTPPGMLRLDKLAAGKNGDGSGVVGNPGRSTRELGRRILGLQIDAAVVQLRNLRENPRR